MRGSRDPAELVVLAVRAARAAGQQLERAQEARLDGHELSVDAKSSSRDPVSEADRAAERTIVELVLAARPDDGIVGEEDQADRPGTTGLRWLIDPLDGTVNYVHHVPHWSVSVAVVDDDGPLVGAVHHPALRETFHALRGGGAWLAERRLHVDDPPRLDGALVSTGFAYDAEVRADQLAAFADWAPHVRYVRRLGSAALELAWVAAGRLHAHAEACLNEWDWAAGSLLVTEAGGLVSHVDVPTPTGPRSTMVAAGPATHDLLVAQLTHR